MRPGSFHRAVPLRRVAVGPVRADGLEVCARTERRTLAAQYADHLNVICDSRDIPKKLEALAQQFSASAAEPDAPA